jgi:2'-5' RNA ligase
MTLARAARSGPVVAPDPDEPVDTPPIRVEKLILFESQLDPAGARYTARFSFALRETHDGP